MRGCNRSVGRGSGGGGGGVEGRVSLWRGTVGVRGEGRGERREEGGGSREEGGGQVVYRLAVVECVRSSYLREPATTQPDLGFFFTMYYILVSKMSVLADLTQGP